MDLCSNVHNVLYFVEDALKSVDEILTTSYELPTKPLTPTSSEDEPEVIDLTESDIEEEVSEVKHVVVEVKQEVTEISQSAPVPEEGAVGGKIQDVERVESNEAVVQDENGNTSSECTTPDEDNKALSNEEIEKEKKKRGREGSPRWDFWGFY